MKMLRLDAFGPAHEVVACVDTPDPGPPDAGEVLVEVQACSINPADLLLVEGRYATRPELPAPLGIEGAGRVLAVGEGVEGLAEGDQVLSLARANWVERLRVPAAEMIRMPSGLDVRQVGMLKVNPATALMMLRDYVDLAAGDWVMQNAANSAVGRNLVRLASARGLRSVNVVRRDSLVAELQGIGADVVLTDGDDLPVRVAEATGGAAIRLGVDAVAGAASDCLAACLAEGAPVVNYGLLSGAPCQLGAEKAIFRDIRLQGFWLARRLRGMAPPALQELYGELAGRLADGTLGVPVEAAYRLEDCADALRHARRSGRDGKVIFTPGG